jgi:hypothetical protein
MTSPDETERNRAAITAFAGWRHDGTPGHRGQAEAAAAYQGADRGNHGRYPHMS